MPRTSPGGGEAEGDFSVCLANFSPCSLSLAPEIRTQSSRAMCMIETAYVHVCVRLCVCVWQVDICHYDGCTAPLWLLAIRSQEPHFKWIWGVCCFITYPVCTAPLASHIDSALSFLAPYLLISVLVTLNQQNGTY